jgi:hypothetical protein
MATRRVGRRARTARVARLGDDGCFRVGRPNARGVDDGAPAARQSVCLPRQRRRSRASGAPLDGLGFLVSGFADDPDGRRLVCGLIKRLGGSIQPDVPPAWVFPSICLPTCLACCESALGHRRRHLHFFYFFEKTKTVRILWPFQRPIYLNHVLTLSFAPCCIQAGTGADAGVVDVVVADKHSRTPKFLYGLIKGLPIVTPDWLKVVLGHSASCTTPRA